jgi:hypothetical protein
VLPSTSVMALPEGAVDGDAGHDGVALHAGGEVGVLARPERGAAGAGDAGHELGALVDGVRGGAHHEASTVLGKTTRRCMGKFQRRLTATATTTRAPR